MTSEDVKLTTTPCSCTPMLVLPKKQVAAARLLHTCPTFSRSVMVSIAVSVLCRTSIHFVELSVKVNGRYHRDVLLMQELLPYIR